MKKRYEAPQVAEYGSMKELVLSSEGGSTSDSGTPHKDDSKPNAILSDLR